MLPFADRPRRGDACPKCDFASAVPTFETWSVRYDQYAEPLGGNMSWSTPQLPRLVWSCARCGYSIDTETADAQAEVPA